MERKYPICDMTMKQKLPSEDEAWELAESIMERNRERGLTLRLRIYFCVWCQCWHLTKAVQRPPRRQDELLS